MNWSESSIDQVVLAMRNDPTTARQEAIRASERGILEAPTLCDIIRACDVEQQAVGHEGKLAGAVFTVKDNIDVAGVVSGCGSPIFADFVAEQNAWIVQRLLDQGAFCIGKSNMNELALGRRQLGGVVRNPINPAYWAGGSSGGCAAAVAAGRANFGIGTDTGGSVRIPAAWCGIVGFKPTPDLLDMRGVRGYGGSADCLGLLARSVADVSRILMAVVNDGIPADIGDRGRQHKVRVLHVAQPLFSRMDEEMWLGYQQAIGTLAAHEAFECIPDELKDLRFGLGILVAVAYPEFAGPLATRIQRSPSDFSPSALKFLRAGIITSASQYVLAQHARMALRRWLIGRMDEAAADVVVTPTVLQRPPLAETVTEDVIGDFDALKALFSYTVPFNAVGMPALTLPVGATGNGLSIAMQVVGRPGADRAVVGIAEHVESVL